MNIADLEKDTQAIMDAVIELICDCIEKEEKQNGDRILF